jgi:endo-1,4-beta-D-glucanase Y
MFRRLIVLQVLLLLCSNIAFSAAKFPFPAKGGYKYGIWANSENFSNEVQKNYSEWLSKYYEESGNLARIKFDNPSETVSEGIGYGMLIMVYMDNSLNNTKEKFNKLWNYYKKFPNENQLMHWKINGFTNVSKQNAATDAELDVAVGLLMAFYQWGDQSYLTDAKDLIGKIWKYEVNERKYLKPGDVWDGDKNPSYFSTAAFELFKSVDNNDWSTLTTNSYNLIKKVQHSTSGLVPDWCSEAGNPTGQSFGYDAVRTPWRMAWAYAWYNHGDAKVINDKIASWIISKTGSKPADIKAGYSLDGNATVGYGNALYTSALTCAGMCSATNQTWVNTGTKESVAAAADSYFNKTLKVLMLLLLSGNMPDYSKNLSSANTTRPLQIYQKTTQPAKVINLKNASVDFHGSIPFSINGRIQTGKHVSSNIVLMRPLRK